MKALPQLTFVEAVKTCFKKYATFSGRARRSEFWWFSVLNGILYCCTYALVSWKMAVKSDLESQIGEALFDSDKMAALEAQAQSCDNIFFPLLVIIGIVGLILLLPGLGVTVRRLHDTGRSGNLLWLYLIPLVNCVIGILVLVYALQDSKPEANKFGPSPKYVEE